MHARDKRHGTEAGHEQHVRDDETPCEPCHHAKVIAARRRTKRKAMGHDYQRPLGDLYWKLQALHKQGATYDDLTEWSGVVESQLWRALTGGPEMLVYLRTWERIDAMIPGRIITPLGVTRRIQALMWLGYSTDRIAAAAGCHVDSVRDSRDEPRVFVSRKFKNGIADAYDRLSMELPTGASQQDRAGITRARNLARRRGWAPPLVWSDIDSADEHAHEWQYVAPDRESMIRDLNDLGVGVSEACRRLNLSRDALQKWCGTHGMSDVYRALASREQLAGNQYVEEAS